MAKGVAGQGLLVVALAISLVPVSILVNRIVKQPYMGVYSVYI